MYIDAVCVGYVLEYCLCIWVLYTCILMVYMDAIKMQIDCVYGCYIHVY